MLAFVVKRLLWFFPISILMLLLIYVMYNMTAYDQLLDLSGQLETDQSISISDRDIKSTASTLGLDQASFYFTFPPLALSKSYYELYDPDKKRWFKKLAMYFGDRETADLAFNSFLQLEKKKGLTQIKYLKDLKSLKARLLSVNTEEVDAETTEFISLINSDKRNPCGTLPIFRWHGTDNRFHTFCATFFSKTGLRSDSDGQPVFGKIYSAASITLGINLIALLLIVLISIPFGLWLFSHRFTPGGRIVRVSIYAIYALPLFWMATLILSLSVNSGFASLSGGTPELYPHELPWLGTFLRPPNFRFFLLPILTIVLAGISYISIQMYRAAEDIHDKKYIRSARARGLSELVVNKKHNRPNAIHTIITILGNSLPGLISGSVVIELIFNIPGMGRLIWNALFNFDWPLVSAILFLAIIFSIAGQLIADYLYVKFNPSLRYES
jgi:peptide/nickel transport system permease protein